MMNKNFDDEVKSRFYEALQDCEGDISLRTKDSLIDKIEELVQDRTIYYSQGTFARAHYTDEMEDYFSNNDWLKESPSFNPYDPQTDLMVYTCMLSDSLRSLAEEVLSESQICNEGITQDFIISQCSKIDQLEESDICFEQIAKVDFGVAKEDWFVKDPPSEDTLRAMAIGCGGSRCLEFVASYNLDPQSIYYEEILDGFASYNTSEKIMERLVKNPSVDEKHLKKLMSIIPLSPSLENEFLTRLSNKTREQKNSIPHKSGIKL